MTEEELQRTFRDFNARYFDNKLKCELNLTENWMDTDGKYYPDSDVTSEDPFEGICDGVKVRRAKPLYTHSEDLIRIPKWMLEGEKTTQALLLHEMAHSAADEPETDHGPKWHAEMHRLWKQHAPINLHDVTPGCTNHALVEQYGVGSEFWNKL
jgi:hypothetical protein